MRPRVVTNTVTATGKRPVSLIAIAQRSGAARRTTDRLLMVSGARPTKFARFNSAL